MTASTTHVPPQNIEAEESVLGAMLVAELALSRVIDEVKLNAADFYLDRHRAIFECARCLHEESKPVDELSVEAALTAPQRKAFEQGGVSPKHYVSELAAKVPAAGNAKHYAEIVRKASRLRGVIDNAQRATSAAYEGTLNGEALELTEALRRLTAQTCSLPVRGADISRARPVRWAWERRLPLGYLSLLLGAEGVGKGTLSAWLIARVTNGDLPGDLHGESARVLLVGDEDSFDSVVVPRLYAAGADLEFIDTLSEEDGADFLDIRRDSEALRVLISERGYRLVLLDALLDTLGVDVDDWRSKAVRDALRPLRRVARDTEVAMLGSLHPNKGQRTSYRDLVSGSHAFNASSRSSLLLAEHPDDENRRVLVRGKGNLSAAPPAFDFAIEGRDLDINGHGYSLPVVADAHESDVSVDDVLKPQREAPVRESLADEINAVGTGKVQARADIARALGRDPTDRSVGRALDQLEDQGRWEKVGRGKWRAIGIGTSSEAPMSKAPEEAML
ncbi:MAG TPA: DnaB-like helicase N-terminal domain-containing protein [Solirubrobacterales bacterium]|nr:DnaB-like helicase N-terminal domain-containing protein [Solirubrobacterales bacterium]